jgi:transposase
MNREDLAASALLALPVAIREARGEEILGTLLDCGRPRVTCPEHGTIQVRLPWAEPLSRFTTRFESWAVDQLSECSVTGAGRLLRTSWDETWGLMARAVARGQAVKEPSAPRHVGVDEKSVGHGQDYITVVSDLDRSTTRA